MSSSSATGSRSATRSCGLRVRACGQTERRARGTHSRTPSPRGIYQTLSPSTRRRLHQTIGERLEQGHGEGTAEVASELAAHFARSGDGARAARYHGEAAAHARSRFAYQEARGHLDAALAWHRGQPDTPAGRRREALLLHALGSTLFSINGHADEDAARAFARMSELAEGLDDAARCGCARDGQLLRVHTVQAELSAAGGGEVIGGPSSCTIRLRSRKRGSRSARRSTTSASSKPPTGKARSCAGSAIPRCRRCRPSSASRAAACWPSPTPSSARRRPHAR